jgi:transposase
LHIAEHFYAQSALVELLGIPSEKVNENRLYRALDALLPHKEALVVSKCGMPLGYEDLWKAYIQLTEAEAAFRIHKSDLVLRPIWHQKEERVLAHILVCFLAYVLWKTLGQMCRRAGLGHEPRRVFEELGKIQLVDVALPTRQGTEIRRRCITQPTDHQAILLTHLRLNLPAIRLMEGL